MSAFGASWGDGVLEIRNLLRKIEVLFFGFSGVFGFGWLSLIDLGGVGVEEVVFWSSVSMLHSVLQTLPISWIFLFYLFFIFV